MEALVFTKPNEMIFRNEPDPVQSNDLVTIKLSASGICGSDMHAYHGHDARRIPPMILGHEGVGIAESGDLTGKRVAVNPLIPCGICWACESARTNMCPDRLMIGMQYPGTYAQYAQVPEKNLLVIPDHITDLQASLTEPAACLVHAAERAQALLSRPLNEASCMVLGGGAIGVLAALVLAKHGVSDIWLAEPNPLRRKTAENLGVAKCFDPSKTDGPGPASVDVVIDAVGIPLTRNNAIKATKPGGWVLHIGLQEAGGVMDTRAMTLNEIGFLGLYTYSNMDVKASLKMIGEGLLGDEAWIEERPLSEGARAFQDIDAAKTASAKIVLRM